MSHGIDAFSSASDMLAALRRREIGATELLELHLSRIEAHNPALNAIVIQPFDGARVAARAADEARARGEDGQLLGLPITLKDSINAQGLRTTMGMPAFADNVSPVDAPVAARLRAAGAVLIGKTNVPPMLVDFQSANPIFGRTNNPWDLTRTPGGSSGGGAAAVAAGLSPLRSTALCRSRPGRPFREHDRAPESPRSRAFAFSAARAATTPRTSPARRTPRTLALS